MSNQARQCGYGVIEGFFGEPWSWQARSDYARFLKDYNYHYYIYAPKADRFLRRQWREQWPADQSRELEILGARYHEAGLRWGIGFSPFEIYLNYDNEARAALREKILTFNSLKPDILAI